MVRASALFTAFVVQLIESAAWHPQLVPSRGFPVWGYFHPLLVHRTPFHPEPTAMELMVDITNALGVAILQDHSYSRGNFAFSPYGMASVLVVLYEGACGESARQIQRTVGFPMNMDVIRVGFRDIHRHLRSYFSHEGFLSGITLNKDASAFNPEYKMVLKFYGYDIDSPVDGDKKMRDENATMPLTTKKSTSTTTIRTLQTTGAHSTGAMTNSFPAPVTVTTPTEPSTADSMENSSESHINPSTMMTSVMETAFTTKAAVTTTLVTTKATELTTVTESENTSVSGIESEITVPPSTDHNMGTEEISVVEMTSSVNEIYNEPTQSTIEDSDANESQGATVPATPMFTSDMTVVMHELQTTTQEPSWTEKQEVMDSSLDNGMLIPQTIDLEATTTSMTSQLTSVYIEDQFVGFTTTQTKSQSVATLTPESLVNDDVTTQSKPEEETSQPTKVLSDIETETTETLSSKSTSSPSETTTQKVGPEEAEEASSPTTSKPSQTTMLSTDKTDDSYELDATSEVYTGETTKGNPDDNMTTLRAKESVAVEEPEEKELNENVSAITTTENSLGLETIVTEINHEQTTMSSSNQTESENTTAFATSTVPYSLVEETILPKETEITTTESFTPTSITTLPTVEYETTTTHYDPANLPRYTRKVKRRRRVPLKTSNRVQISSKSIVGNGFSISRKRAKKSFAERTRWRRTIIDYLKSPIRSDLSQQLQGGMSDTYFSQNLNSYTNLAKYLFLVDGAVDTPVPMMTYTNIFPFGYIPRLHSKALEFPLDDVRYKLLILLPLERRGLRQLLHDLGSCSLREVIESIRPVKVRATIPTFMVEGFVILTSTLQKLGIWDVFDPRKSNLSGMSSDPELYVRNVEQSVTVVIRNYVEIFDIQTRTMAARQVLHHFEASHPFVYFVLDTATNVALMAGQMLDPLNSRIY